MIFVTIIRLQVDLIVKYFLNYSTYLLTCKNSWKNFKRLNANINFNSSIGFRILRERNNVHSGVRPILYTFYTPNDNAYYSSEQGKLEDGIQLCNDSKRDSRFDSFLRVRIDRIYRGRLREHVIVCGQIWPIRSRYTYVFFISLPYGIILFEKNKKKKTFL